jgi:CHAT domain-containing protein
VRFSFVHIGGLRENQAASIESQAIHPIQLFFGPTLRGKRHGAIGRELQKVAVRCEVRKKPPGASAPAFSSRQSCGNVGITDRIRGQWHREAIMMDSMYPIVQTFMALRTPFEFLIPLDYIPERLSKESIETIRRLAERPLWPRQRARLANILHLVESCAERGVDTVRGELVQENVVSWQGYAMHYDIPDGDEEHCPPDPGTGIGPYACAAILSDLAYRSAARSSISDGVVLASLHGAAGDAMLNAGTAPEPEWTDRTIEHLESALETITPEVDKLAWARFRRLLGIAYRTQVFVDPSESIEKAIDCFEDALSIHTQESDLRGWTVSTFQLGKAYLDRIAGDRETNNKEAMSRFEAVLNVLRAEDDWRLWAEAKIELGRAWALRPAGDSAQNLARALETFETLREAAIAMEDTIGEGYVDMEIGAALTARGCDKEQIIRCYRKALEKIGPDVDWGAWCRCNVSLAGVLLAQREGNNAPRIEEAITVLRDVLTRSRERDIDPSGFVHAYLGTAYLLRETGTPSRNQDRAILFYDNAVNSEDAGSEPLIWRDMAFAYRGRTRGDAATNIERSIECFKTSLAMQMDSEGEGDVDQLAWTHAELAQTYLSRLNDDLRDNIKQAQNHALAALKLTVNGERRCARASAIGALGFVYAHFEDLTESNFDRAIGVLEDALGLCAESGNPYETSRIAQQLGNVFMSRSVGDRASDVETAIAYYEKALHFSESLNPNESKAGLLLDMGRAYLKRQRDVPAKNQAIATSCIEQAGALVQSSFFLVLQHLAEAEVSLTTGRDHWNDAAQAIERAFDAFEDCWREAMTSATRTQLMSRMTKAGSWAAIAHVATGNYSTALERLEAIRAIAFGETITIEEAITSESDGEKRTAIQVAARRVTALRAEAAGALKSSRPYRHVADELSAAQEKLSEALGGALNIPDVPIEELLKSLPEESVLIVPVATEFGGLVFVIPAGVAEIDNRHVIDMPSLTFSEVYDRGRKWSAAYHDARTSASFRGQTSVEPEAWATTAHMLTDVIDWLETTVMDPVLEKVRELTQAHRSPDGSDRSAHLVIVPTGDFATLPMHAASCTFGGEKRPLLREHAVSYTPSLRALTVAVARARRAGDEEKSNLLALLNPTHDLRFGETIEAPALHRLFPEGLLLIGNNAEKAELLQHASTCRYLHLSCHGRFDNVHPDSSGLKLADGEWLTLPEIAGSLTIDKCRWVMLSACETGRVSTFRAPDESVGPITAFLMAGAACVTGALWAMPDVSAALVAARAYEEHLHRHLPPAQAVRAAVLWLMDLSRDDLRRIIGSEDGGAAWRYRLADIDDAPGAGGSAPDAERPFAAPLFWAPFTVWGM